MPLFTEEIAAARSVLVMVKLLALCLHPLIMIHMVGLVYLFRLVTILSYIRNHLYSRSECLCFRNKHGLACNSGMIVYSFIGQCHMMLSDHSFLIHLHSRRLTVRAGLALLCFGQARRACEECLKKWGYGRMCS